MEWSEVEGGGGGGGRCAREVRSLKLGGVEVHVDEHVPSSYSLTERCKKRSKHLIFAKNLLINFDKFYELKF